MSEDLSQYTVPTSLNQETQFIENIDQVYIRTTEDKLINYIRDYRDCVYRISRWQAPASFSISFGATLLTASFSEKFGRPASFWEALFLFFFIGSIVWMVISGFRAAGVSKKTTVESLIRKIKNDF